MDGFDLDDFLRKNPRAAKQADTIRKAMDDVRKLRETKSGRSATAAAAPYGGVAAFGRMPKSSSRERFRSFSKVTFST